MPDVPALLERTSRTFALAIPFLPQPLRRQVGVAYLLFRIADTIEDAPAWGYDQRVNELTAYRELLDAPQSNRVVTTSNRWLANPPCDHDGYLELLHQMPTLLLDLAQLDAAAAHLIRGHLLRAIDGMVRHLRTAAAHGRFELHSVGDLRDYCYVVAGIVGELLTDLFNRVSRIPLFAAAHLRGLAPQFGEALQLVNVLKDSTHDAAEGRFLIPAKTTVEEVACLARQSLDQADEYNRVLADSGVDPGILAFTWLPVRLARATLNAIQQHGLGAKVSREVVLAMLGELRRAFPDLEPNEQPVALSESTS